MLSDRLDLLYDHYKETFKLIVDQNKLRDRLFIYLLIILLLMFLQISSAEEVNDISVSLAEKFLGVSLSLSQEFITTMIWFIALSLVMKYAQTLVYIEKQYDYIHKLELTIDKELGGKKIFSREGHSYLTEYPKFSTWAWMIYTIIFPLMFLSIVGYKIYSEFTGSITLPFFINSIICCMIGVSIVLYLLLIHFKK